MYEYESADIDDQEQSSVTSDNSKNEEENVDNNDTDRTFFNPSNQKNLRLKKKRNINVKCVLLKLKKKKRDLPDMLLNHILFKKICLHNLQE